MRSRFRQFTIVLGLLSVTSAAHAAGDAVAGRVAFDNQCAACHTSVIGKNGFGPSLAGVVGRKSGTLAGYAYTPAMTHANLTWDAATLDRILADDWVGRGPTGIATKAQALADLKSGDNKLDSQTLGEMKVRVFGNTAVVTGSDDEKSSYKGKDTGGHYVWTDIFVKRNGRWQAVASQGTLMAQKMS